MSGYKLDHALKIKPADLISYIHEYNVDPVSNHIYLFGEEHYADLETQAEPGVEYSMANRFIRNLNICMRANPAKSILIHMKTCGGYWEEGMAIYNTIRACHTPVTILNYTHARSMSSLIFLAANKRIMMPDSYFMFHDGTLGIEGTVKQVHGAVDFGKKADDRMLDIYVAALREQGKFQKWSDNRIRKYMRSLMDRKEDVYLTATEAVEWGFADGIFGENGYDWGQLVEYTEKQLER